MSSLILHEKYIKLKQELSDKLFEYEDLINHICPNIEHIFIMEFGTLEYKIYELDMKINRIKRKINMIQYKINHEKEIDLDLIDEELDKEFEEYLEKLKELQDEIKYAFDKELMTTSLSEEDAKELKRLYKIIIKRLHPDLNKNLSENDRELFLTATEAYAQGNLKVIKSIYLLLEEDSDDALEDLKDIEELIKEIDEKILKIKQDYPYNKKELIENEELIANYKSELNNLIELKEDNLNRYNEKLNQLIKNV